jgi:hypothetical protein
VEPRIRSTFLRITVLSVLGFLLSCYAWWPMFYAWPNTPELDGRYVYQLILIGKATFHNFGEWPLWNPYDCRGIPLWDHPEGMASSPLLFLLYPLPAMPTYYLWNILHMAPGWVGMWLLARDDYRLSRLASFAAACMWAFGCCHTTQYCGAHETFAALWLFPILLLLWRRAENSVGAAVWLGIMVAFFVYDGATYPLPLSVAVLAFEAMLRMWPLRRLLAILRAGAITGVVGVTLSAARLFPLLAQLALHKRYIVDVDHLLRLNTLGAMWLHHEPNWLLGLPNQQYVWGEYLTYIGFASLLVALMGLWVATKRDWRLVILATIVFVVMLGHFSPVAPWTLLHRYVPIFTSMRVPSRFRLILQCMTALFVAFAVEDARRRSPPVRVLVTALAFIGIGDMMGLGFDIIQFRFHGPPPAYVETADHFYYGGKGVSADFADAVRQNRGWVGCRSYEWPSYYEAPIWQGDVAQVRAMDDSAKIENAHRTSSTFSADVDVKKPTVILLNSGYAVGWRTNVGTVVEQGGMLGVELPPGYHKVRVHYWPRLMTLGIVTSSVSLAGIVAFFVVRWRIRRRSRVKALKG